MKFNVYVKKGLVYSEKVDYITKLFNGQISDNPEYVFTFGGDGTFLDALDEFGYSPIYVPINMGTLGFYSSWSNNNCHDLKQDVKDNNVLDLLLLKIMFENEGQLITKHAVNEMTIVNPINTQILDIEINGHLFEKFRGSGICISTPTGSTAYNKSLGGAVISSNKQLFQLVKMAPINNIKYRTISNPIIFDKDEEICLVAEQGSFMHSILTVDRHTYNMNTVEKIKIGLSDVRVKLLVPKANNFYDRVHDAFIN